MQTVTITRPDDWHVHFRDGAMLEQTVPATAKHFERALVMPNLKPALVSVKAVLAYRERILAVLPKNSSFSPIMTLYLNEKMSPDEFDACGRYPFIAGAKLYPAGATTNSDEGVQSLTALYPLLDIMQERSLVLQIHGEVTHGDIFEREETFIAEQLQPIIKNFPKLRIVFEHISTRYAVDFIKSCRETVSATITPQHLLYNRNHLLAGGIRPHYYCLPILKQAGDQSALIQAAISGNPKFFAGTDSAPHTKETKETACGCAGIYSAPFAVALYTQVFDELNALDRLNDFLGHFGARFYQVPYNSQELILVKKKQRIPDKLPLGSSYVVPIASGEDISWSVHDIA